MSPSSSSLLKPSKSKLLSLVSPPLTGKPFDYRPEKCALESKDLANMVKTLYLKSKSEKRNLVAYKGGPRPKRLIRIFGHPFNKMEDNGYARYSELIDTGYERANGCGQHAAGEETHCPTAECRALFKCFKLTLQRHEFKNIQVPVINFIAGSSGG